jgi:hypothetical protein
MEQCSDGVGGQGAEESIGGRSRDTTASVLEKQAPVWAALLLSKRGVDSMGRWGQADATLKAQFDTLTECASDLMANGEYEVYSDTKRVFERDAGMSLSTVSKGVSPVPSSAGYRREGPSSQHCTLPVPPGTEVAD